MGKRNTTKSVPMGASVSPLTLARIQVLARDNQRTVSAEASHLLDTVLETSAVAERILLAAREQDAADTQRSKTDPRTPARQVLVNLAGQIAAAPAVPAIEVAAPAKNPGPKLVPPSAQPKNGLVSVDFDGTPAEPGPEHGITFLVRPDQVGQPVSGPDTPEPDDLYEEVKPAQPTFVIDTMVPEVIATPAEEKKVPEGNPPAPDPAPVVDDAPADPLPSGKGLPIGLLSRLSKEKD
jgi:hypothetical protein